ncbi:MAG: hypothetical protein ACYC96_16890 [Fimbriimonadaceae bacterium]
MKLGQSIVVGVASVSFAGALAVMQAGNESKDHVARNAKPGKQRPKHGHPIKDIDSSKVLDKLHRSGAKGGSIASHVRLTGGHLRVGRDYLDVQNAADVSGGGNEIYLTGGAGYVTAFHHGKRGVPFLVDFVVDPLPISGQGGINFGNVPATVKTNAPDGTTQVDTISRPTHLSVIVYPTSDGIYPVQLGNAGDFRDIVVNRVEISEIGP